MAGRLAAWSTPEMLPAHAIDAVVFDMGGVFMVPCPRRIGDELTAAGIEHGLDGETAPGAHYAGVRAITDLLADRAVACLLYTSPSPRDVEESRMPSSA